MAYVSPDDQEGAYVIVGPPEGLVDTLLTEPMATTLHNVLFDRGLYNYKAIAANQKIALGVANEVKGVNAQQLVEAFFKFENETVT